MAKRGTRTRPRSALRAGPGAARPPCRAASVQDRARRPRSRLRDRLPPAPGRGRPHRPLPRRTRHRQGRQGRPALRRGPGKAARLARNLAAGRGGLPAQRRDERRPCRRAPGPYPPGADPVERGARRPGFDRRGGRESLRSGAGRARRRRPAARTSCSPSCPGPAARRPAERAAAKTTWRRSSAPPGPRRGPNAWSSTTAPTG